ncbi:hypothetical protein QE152_g9630 [Popillia japonica]|uniref:Uncharacterized protein n=1 Tax=Popillia japonica TaxID=7064 RepID=A0AAW1LXV1_POPJA
MIRRSQKTILLISNYCFTFPSDYVVSRWFSPPAPIADTTFRTRTEYAKRRGDVFHDEPLLRATYASYLDHPCPRHTDVTVVTLERCFFRADNHDSYRMAYQRDF